MVIAGVWVGLILAEQLICLLDFSLLFSIVYLLSAVLTLLYSLYKAISVSDVKSIIAFSTVSQISYMFLALVINPVVCIFTLQFMHYLRACSFSYLDQLLLFNQTINRYWEWK
jgi:NADH:ubiquinone oxidoreductase subunit 5 (subunit L)/multisubunit Na+/H+ antiporter MnhA subunit